MDSKKLFIGISVNGVLRDFFGRIESTHTKYFNPEDGQEIKIKDYDLEKWIKFPEEEIVRNEIEFQANFDEKEFIKSESSFEISEVKDEPITVDDFIYNKCCLEIFGYAEEEMDGIVQSLNDFELHLKMLQKNHELVITSREAGRSVPSTLFFLAKTGCMIQNIKFTMGTTDCWKDVDCMITDHPEILKTKPTGKITIKIEKPFNQDIDSDYTIRSIKELPGLDIFV
jgi:hypothetical protein